jgi:phage gp29-like protein
MATELKAPKKPDMQEIASIVRDPMLVQYNNTLRHEDETLLTRGNVKSYKIYDDLERDAHAGAVLDKRKMAVTSRPWEVNAASDEPRDVQAAEVVRTALQGMQFDKLCEDLLDGTLKGFAVAEVMWEVRDGLIMPSQAKPRQQRRFVFNLQNELRLKTRAAMLEGEQLPERKFIVHTYGGKDGSPYGLGLGSKVFWPVWFKKQGITFWLTFADKFGSPTALGKYPTGATKEEQGKLLQALSAIAQDAGVIVPEGMVIELLEASRSGTIDTYEKLCRYMDEQISKAVLGETMSTTAASTGMGSNQANVQNDVRKELAERDAKLLCETIRRTLMAWLVEFNVPGARIPSLVRNFDEPEDLSARAERDTKILSLGYEPTEQYILDTYGEGWVKKQASAPMPLPFGAPAMQGAQDAAQFSEAVVSGGRSFNRDAQDAMVMASDALAGTWNKTMRQRVEDLQAIAEQTGDLAQFRERLADLLSSPPPADLVESMARANFAAHLLGRGRASDAQFSEPVQSRFKGIFKRLFQRP